MMNPVRSDKVVHNYQDRSEEPDPEPADEEGKSIPVGMDHNFPTKLHYMLSSIEADGQAHVISWQPHGRCFMVHDMKEFVSSMLPLWFRQTKFASFQRQLNLYGFQRLTQGRDKNAYYHQYFLRSRPLLAQKIVRTKVKGRGARKASSPETEPQLYDFPWMNEAATPSPTLIPVDPSGFGAHAAIDPPSVPSTAGSSPSPGVPAGALAQAQGGPDGLGDALGFLNTLMMPAQATVSFPGAEPMFLPTPTDTLNSLLAYFAPSQRTPSNFHSNRFVPIAPAPPAPEGEPHKPTLDTCYNDLGTVLTALKAQHRRDSMQGYAAQQQQQQHFTIPGPTSF